MSKKDKVAEEVACLKWTLQELEKGGEVGRELLDLLALPHATAADLLGIEVGSLKDMANQGKILYVKTESGRASYRIRDLVAFIEKRRQPPGL